MKGTPRPEGKNSAGFVFDDAEATAPRKILNIAQAELYFVSFTNGESKKEARLVVRAPGSKNSFLLQDRISGQFVVQEGADWFQPAFYQKLCQLGFVEGAEETAEGAEQL
jgi:hypothetical protein